MKKGRGMVSHGQRGKGTQEKKGRKINNTKDHGEITGKYYCINAIKIHINMCLHANMYVI